jgi:hypothetical protein
MAQCTPLFTLQSRAHNKQVFHVLALHPHLRAPINKTGFSDERQAKPL